jgi:SET domain-containing protein
MADKRSELIKHLENDIYCRLGVNKNNEVGVMAIKNIPKGTDPFKTLTKNKDEINDIITLEEKDVTNLNKNVLKIIDRFFGSEKSKNYDILASGPNNINISFYMNNSGEPNVDIYDDPDSEYLGFITNRLIEEGEELTIDYSKYDEDETDSSDEE